MMRNADLDFAVFQPARFTGDASADPGPSPLGDDLCRFLYLQPPWTTAAVIWRRETLMRLGLFDEKLLGWQDLELQVRAITAGCHYARFPEVDHRAQGCGAPTSLDGALDAIARLEADVCGGPGMNWVRQRALCSLYFHVARGFAARRDRKSALEAWRPVRARRLGPPHLHATGAALLRLRAAGAPCEATIEAWKGWARLTPASESGARGGSAASPRSVVA
jgi:hypothetical protein